MTLSKFLIHGWPVLFVTFYIFHVRQLLTDERPFPLWMLLIIGGYMLGAAIAMRLNFLSPILGSLLIVIFAVESIARLYRLKFLLVVEVILAIAFGGIAVYRNLNGTNV